MFWLTTQWFFVARQYITKSTYTGPLKNFLSLTHFNYKIGLIYTPFTEV